MFFFFNEVGNFYVLKNTSVDIMHDLFKGVVKNGLLFLLRHYIYFKHYFPLVELNSKLNRFNYGSVDVSNKPPLFLFNSLKKSNP